MIPTNLLPENVKWCIAGGYAACPALAGDVDIWVMAEGPIFDAYAQIVTHLQQTFDDERLVISPRPDMSHDRSVHELYVDDVTIEVAQLYTDGRNFHIMVTYNATPEAIIQRFDISTHQVAVTSTGRVVLGPQWTPPHVMPTIIRHTGDRTAKRYEKICHRYGHQTVLA